MRDKIRKINELGGIAEKLKKEGKTIIQCHGVFDLVHPGHIRYLEAAAKRKKDVLVVTITRDEYVNKGPGRPVFNQALRCEQIAALDCVDYVALSEHPTAVEAILTIKPDFYVKGSDYKDFKSDLTGGIGKEAEAVESVGGVIRFIDELTFSSTELLNAYFGVYGEEADRFLKTFRKEHKANAIIQNLQSLQDLKILVIGEAIVDEYLYCRAIGKSPKDVIITAKYEGEDSFAGGALACANHLAGFCQKVDLITCLGKPDSKETFIRNHLKKNITPKFFYRFDSCTIVKRRFVDPAFLTKMLQVCYLNDQPLPQNVDGEICGYLKKHLSHYDLVVVTDYGHGFIGKKMVETLCHHSKYLAVNTQSNSLNLGYNLIYKYPRADYVCLDDPEIRLATRSRSDDMEGIMREVLGRLECSSLTVTRGHRGSINYNSKNGFTTIPALSQKIVDRMGAGDAYLAVTAPCVAKGFSIEEVGFIGNAVGAMAVGYVGNKQSIEPDPLFKFIQTLLK